MAEGGAGEAGRTKKGTKENKRIEKENEAREEEEKKQRFQDVFGNYE